MAVIVEYLAGTQELFAETIRKIIAANWVPANTETVTPKIMSTHGEDNIIADVSKMKSGTAWGMYENKDFVRLHNGETRQYKMERSSGAKFWRMITFVNIDIFAQTDHRKLLFEEEINRIVSDVLPNTTVRIKKSNTTEDSAIATFEKLLIEWTPIGAFSEHGIRMQSSGTLGCIWQKRKL